MKEAFYYMFKDNKFAQKALVYFVFALIANLLLQIGSQYAPLTKYSPIPIQYYIFILSGYIALLIPTGYSINCIKALMEQKENPVLPMLNIKSSIVLGFKLALGIILLSLTFGVLYALVMIPVAILIATGLATVAGIIVIAFLGLSILTISIYSPAFSAIISKKEWITSFFRFIRATNLIKQGVGNYFKYTALIIFLMILFTFINMLIISMLSKDIIGAVIVSVIISVISSYTMFVFAYLVARSVKPECIE